MDNRWTDAVDEEADAYFATLSTRELRKRQDLCHQQQRMAYDRGLTTTALEDLNRMDLALIRAMFTRTGRR